jgi:TPR repeat protein
MLVEGGGVSQDISAGAEEIGRAAKAGVVAAQVDYATMLYLGQGVKRDLAGAVRWYRQAAEEGNPVAQNRYAKLLAVGEGVDLNLEQAAMWRALARRQGLSDPSLDRLLVSIPPKDLAQAEEEARFWPDSPPTAATPTMAKANVPPSTGAVPKATQPTPRGGK